ncbi:MAG: GldG family protein [Anaerolineales bacterium]|nr:GldG family protein [Anaerolineales bacterium]
MKDSKLSRYAFIGLIVAGLALISSLVFATMISLEYVQLYTPKNPDLPKLGLYISLGAIVIGLAAAIFMAPERTRQMVSGRQARYGSNALVLSLAFVGLLIALNFLANKAPEYNDLFNDLEPFGPYDMTIDKQNTLAPETLEALDRLQDEVTATAFYSYRLNPESARDILSNFEDNGNGNFKYRFVDPDSNPLEAQSMGITGDGKIVLQMGAQQEIVTSATESELTKALIRLIDPKERAVYFLVGHQEADIEATDEAAYSQLRQTLENKNYSVQLLNLLADKAIPEDALAIIIAGPIYPVSSEEMELLTGYLEAGGALVLMEDPTPLTQIGSDDALAAYLQKEWGITLNNDLVVDPNANPASLAISNAYAQHPITEKINGLVTFYPVSRSLSTAEDTESILLTPLVVTNQNAWGETNFESIQNDNVKYNDGEDMPGPIVLAVAAEDMVSGGRLVVFGTSQFPANQYFTSGYGNADMAVNSIDWAAEQEDLLALTPKDTVQRSFSPLTQGQVLATMLGSICLIPGIILVAGIAAWISRRRLG